MMFCFWHIRLLCVRGEHQQRRERSNQRHKHREDHLEARPVRGQELYLSLQPRQVRTDGPSLMHFIYF